MKTLVELRKIYGNMDFHIAHYNKTLIVPKKVKIDDNLNVWHDGACIINGMKNEVFLHDFDKSVVLSLLKLQLKDAGITNIDSFLNNKPKEKKL